MQHTLTMET